MKNIMAISFIILITQTISCGVDEDVRDRRTNDVGSINQDSEQNVIIDMQIDHDRYDCFDENIPREIYSKYCEY